MTYAEYIEHYLKLPDFLIFFGLAVVLLLIFYGIFGLVAKASSKGKKAVFVKKYRKWTECFYEIIFSGTSILLFMASYYLIDRFMLEQSFRKVWDEYNDFLLLGLMVLSIVLNSIFDHFLVKLKALNHEAMAAIRLLGMIYMIVIFCYIKFIYEDNNYDSFISYFLTLMIGRFVYFDASFKDFINSIRSASKFFCIVIVALAFTGIMCLYGFSTGYLLKHNGVITNIFFTHLFICLAICFFQFIPIIVCKKAKKERVDKREKNDIEEEETEGLE